MFELIFKEYEMYDRVKEEFINKPGRIHHFMFNLIALDKWESKHRKRFLDNDQITYEEYLDFFNCMCQEEDFDISLVGEDEFRAIMGYINDVPTATVIPEQKKKTGNRKTIFTSEIIYGYMALSGIPFEWEEKNLNKLITLINTISSLQTPPEKMSRQESLEEQRRIIMERRKQAEKGKSSG